MKALQLELPDDLATQVDQLIREGWFRNHDDLLRAAVQEFIRHHRFELQEKFQRDDIAWAVRERETKR